MTESVAAELENRLWNELAPSAFAFVGLVNDDEGDVPMTMHLDGNDHRSLWIFTTPHSRLIDGGAIFTALNFVADRSGIVELRKAFLNVTRSVQ